MTTDRWEESADTGTRDTTPGERTTIMALKQTLVAGVAALTLLVMPVGLTIQWHGHGPAIATTPAISTALAAPSRPAPKRPTASGGPTFTQTVTKAVTTGWQTGSGKWTDANCQSAADAYDAYYDLAANTGDPKLISGYLEKANAVLDTGLNNGCAFTNDTLPL